jgi:hypothetical protein
MNGIHIGRASASRRERFVMLVYLVYSAHVMLDMGRTERGTNCTYFSFCLLDMT